MRITLDRLLQGGKPSARERWGCFHRLFRLARKADEAVFDKLAYSATVGATDGGAVDALRLLGYCRWVDLLVLGGDPLESSCIMPPDIRRTRIARAQRERLYGKRDQHYDELIPKDLAVRAVLAEEQGMELTPLQAAEMRHKTFRTIRIAAAQHGIHFPLGDGSDVYVLRQLRASR